jgi:hypothetical protein
MENIPFSTSAAEIFLMLFSSVTLHYALVKDSNDVDL